MTTPYDSPDYHALIRNIRHLDRSGEDFTLARLVTADWLEERGESERAEFIRLQGDKARDAAATKRLAELGNSLGSLYPYETYDADSATRGTTIPAWEGGFIRAVQCPLSWWLAHGPDLCRRHPVREVVITGLTPAGDGSIDSDQVRELARTIQKTSPFLADKMLNEAISGMDASSSGAFLLPIMNKYALLWAESEADRQHTA
jgi:uncharacterized protein (TIGR02996 family)